MTLFRRRYSSHDIDLDIEIELETKSQPLLVRFHAKLEDTVDSALYRHGKFVARHPRKVQVHINLLLYYQRFHINRMACTFL